VPLVERARTSPRTAARQPAGRTARQPLHLLLYEHGRIPARPRHADPRDASRAADLRASADEWGAVRSPAVPRINALPDRLREQRQSIRQRNCLERRTPGCGRMMSGRGGRGLSAGLPTDDMPSAWGAKWGANVRRHGALTSHM